VQVCPTKQKGWEFHMKYIITAGVEIKPTEDKIIHVLTPEQINEYKNQGYKYKERRYQVTIGHQDIEIICPEIWKKGDVEHQVILPATIIPRRRYPLEVYLYAINIYCSEAQMSQRTAAEATKKHFDLKKFSHTTIGRVMKTLTKTLEKTPCACTVPTEGKQMGNHERSGQNDALAGTGNEKRFPSVWYTQKRRELIGSFLEGKLYIQSRRGFMETCGQTAVWWYTQFNQLLI